MTLFCLREEFCLDFFFSNIYKTYHNKKKQKQRETLVAQGGFLPGDLCFMPKGPLTSGYLYLCLDSKLGPEREQFSPCLVSLPPPSPFKTGLYWQRSTNFCCSKCKPAQFFVLFSAHNRTKSRKPSEHCKCDDFRGFAILFFGVSFCIIKILRLKSYTRAFT